MHVMTFHWSSDVGDFLFNGLTINSVPSVVILCAILIVLSVLYEGFKVTSIHQELIVFHYE